MTLHIPIWAPWAASVIIAFYAGWRTAIYGAAIAIKSGKLRYSVGAQNRHDQLESRRMTMAVYATQTDEVPPNARCVCGDAAELHRTYIDDVVDDADTDELTELTTYYDECTVQGCGCRLFKMVAPALYEPTATRVPKKEKR